MPSAPTLGGVYSSFDLEDLGSPRILWSRAHGMNIAHCARDDSTETNGRPFEGGNPEPKRICQIWLQRSCFLLVMRWDVRLFVYCLYIYIHNDLIL